MEEVQETKIAVARRVFEYWKKMTKHPRSHMDTRREGFLLDRINEGYTEDDLRLATLGCVSSRWHQGENDRRTVYDSIDLIYRNADKLDSFIRLGIAEKERLENERIRKEEQRQETLKASVPGEGYRAARGKIMELVRKKVA